MSGDALLQMLRSIAQLLAQLEELGPGVGEAPSVGPVLRDADALLDLAQLRPQITADRSRRRRLRLHNPRLATASRQLPRRSPCVAAMLGEEDEDVALGSLWEAALQVLGGRWRM